jgi:hypothetical protein
MIFGLLFGTVRVFQILTMLPAVAVLGYFVHGYTAVNILTPGYILTLFIAATIAFVWAFGTLVLLGCTRRSGILVCIIDVAIWGGLIAGVYALRAIGPSDCDNAYYGNISVDLGPFGIWGASWGSPYAGNINQNCGLLKGAWVLAIINLFLWPASAGLALLNHEREELKEHHEETREYRNERDTRSSHSRTTRSHRTRTFA